MESDYHGEILRYTEITGTCYRLKNFMRKRVQNINQQFVQWLPR